MNFRFVCKCALTRQFPVCLWLSVKMAAANDTEGESERAQEKKVHNTRLYFDISDRQWPVVYSQDYNIGFLGLEKLHPFDAGKWGKVFTFLKEDGMLKDDTIITPREATEEDLLVVHTKRYLNNLKWSVNVATITEVPPVALLPNFIVQRKVLKPFRIQTGGTILAAKLAIERGWAINIGGGFHHCSGDRGGGFCAYADITLAIKFLFERVAKVKSAMIVDLDAHQGNGHERDFMDDNRVYIMDVYNRHIYPHDGFAKRGIKRKVELMSWTQDSEYLQKVKDNLTLALEEFTPDIIVYNAGTDILDGDPLGALSISPEGIIARDQIVFEAARQRKIPILMVTSGGYQKQTARIIANSILNLRQLGLVGPHDSNIVKSDAKSSPEMPPSGAIGESSPTSTKPKSKLS
ncbi:histone deacetylase 11-like isoform X2 [Glandiceps talaboti]